ncbi:protein-disulfide reductase DsbD N-terminal domain-containing protein [Flavobacterium johnsoniae]|uniref:protein-disulfide reductase DsbD domain-containing protein n=1 Tax=Flavobacterium johnsoniae TaxID=986 RepID=UPI0025B054DB|nr:protein-disulfide reductase DsbD domain-containing protein [Flavobacterium johnsoniae]WJS93843.1 protein-disulfide reductase DsbD N-terminal domain-containing protein [Flavobacterium johnsoniae]
MKKIIAILLLLLTVGVKAQVYNPVKWTTSVVKISESEYELIAKAAIEKGWHLYSQTVPEEGPLPTKFSFEGKGEYLKKGNTKEEEGHVVNDPIYGMKIKYFENKTIFKQRIKLKDKSPKQIKASVEFMACDDTKCLPPKEAELLFKMK